MTWSERFDALCLEAWNLGKLDIQGTIQVPAAVQEELKEARKGYSLFICGTRHTQEEEDALYADHYEARKLTNKVTGSVLTVEVNPLITQIWPKVEKVGDPAP